MILSNGWNVRYFPLNAGPPWVLSAYDFSWNPVLPAMAVVQAQLAPCVGRLPWAPQIGNDFLDTIQKAQQQKSRRTGQYSDLIL